MTAKDLGESDLDASPRGAAVTRNTAKRSAAHFFSFLIGVAAGLAPNIIQTYWIERPFLTADIVSIDRQPADGIVISSNSYPTLKSLSAEYYRLKYRHPEVWSSPNNPYSYQSEAPGVIQSDPVELPSIDLLNELIDITKSEYESYPAAISAVDAAQSRITILTADELGELRDVQSRVAAVLRDNQQYTLSYDVPSILEDAHLGGLVVQDATGAPKPATAPESRKLNDDELAELKAALATHLSAQRQQLSKLQEDGGKKLKEAEAEATKAENDVETNETQLVITVVLSNTGHASVAIKEPALLRVYTGDSNYINIPLKVQDYAKLEGTQANSTKVITLRSDQVSMMPATDRDLVNTYWRQSVPAVLFLEDSLGRIHTSKRVAFSTGLYQRQVYDQLEAEAGKPAYPGDAH